MIFESYTVLFIVIFFGVLLSKVKVFNIGLGSSAYIFVALLFGHYGFVIPEVIESFGLILFIFSVGIQAGPGFFDSFRTGEARYYLAPVFILIFLALLFSYISFSYTHLRAHETVLDLVCLLLLEKKYFFFHFFILLLLALFF